MDGWIVNADSDCWQPMPGLHYRHESTRKYTALLGQQLWSSWSAPTAPVTVLHWLHFALPPLGSACLDITIDSPVLDFLLSSSSACEGSTVAPMWNKLAFNNKGWMDGLLIQNRLLTAYAYYTLALGICLKSQDCSSWPIAQPGCGPSGQWHCSSCAISTCAALSALPSFKPCLDITSAGPFCLSRRSPRQAAAVHLCGTALVLQLAGLLLAKKAVSKQQLHCGVLDFQAFLDCSSWT